MLRSRVYIPEILGVVTVYVFNNYSAVIGK